MAFGIYLIIAVPVILVAALIAVALGAYHAFRHGSPAGAISLLLGLIVAALLVAPIVAGADVMNLLGTARSPGG